MKKLSFKHSKIIKITEQRLLKIKIIFYYSNEKKLIDLTKNITTFIIFLCLFSPKLLVIIEKLFKNINPIIIGPIMVSLFTNLDPALLSSTIKYPKKPVSESMPGLFKT